MTTIAYNHKDRQISVDGRLNDGGMVSCDDWQKWHTIGDSIYFSAGCASEIPLFLASFNWGGEAPHEFSCSSIQVTGDDIFLLCVNDGVFKKYPIKYNEAIGFGRLFALSAMDFKSSSKDAVNYAAEKDTYTGGKVHTYDIASKQFIQG